MGRAKLNGQSGGAKINGIIEEYIVQAGSNISAGDFVNFVYNCAGNANNVYNSSAMGYIKAVKLTESSVLVCYRNSATYGAAVVLTISENSISLGTPFVFNAYATTAISAVALSGTKTLIAYTSSGSGLAQILSVSGTTVSAGANINISSASTYTTYDVVKLTETSVFLQYNTDSYGMIAFVLTVNGATLTKGSQNNYVTSIMPYHSAVSLNSAKVLVTYNKSAANCYAMILTISGTTITKNSGIVYYATSVTTSVQIMVKLSDAKVFIAFANNGTLYGLIFDISGTTIIIGQSISLDGNTSVGISDVSVIALSQTRVLVSYSKSNTNGYCAIAYINGSSVSFDTIYTFDTSARYYCESLLLTDYKVLELFINSSTSYGNNVFLTINYFAKLSTTQKEIDGVAKSAGAAGSTIKAFTLAE